MNIYKYNINSIFILFDIHKAYIIFFRNCNIYVYILMNIYAYVYILCDYIQKNYVHLFTSVWIYVYFEWRTVIFRVNIRASGYG